MITFHLVAAHYSLLLLFTTATITTIRYYDYYYYNDYSSLFYFISLLLLILLLCWSSLSSSLVMITISIVIITIVIHIRVYQLRCYRYHQYIDTSLLTENSCRPWRRPWRFNIGKPTESHSHYIGVRRKWRTNVERTCLCLRLSSWNTGTLFNTPPRCAMDTRWRLVVRSHV